MTQRVIRERPPLWDEIVRAFPFVLNRRGVIFSWGDKIYNPHGIEITPSLAAHEAVHERQQRDSGPEVWWRLYMADPAFRLAQEIPAHRAELVEICTVANRAFRRKAANELAARLSSPMYGRMITLKAAKEAIAP